MKVLNFLTLIVLTLIAVVCLIVSPVLADSPMPPIHPDWFAYTVEVLVGETVA